MSFSFGAATTTAASAFGTTTPSTGFSFGGGDSKPVFGGATTTTAKPFSFTSPTANAAPAFGSGGAFSFGAAKTTAAAATPFGASSTTQAATPFGAPATQATSPFGGAKPLGFGSFSSPPNQTVGTPAFGQTAQPAANQSLSFGAITQQQAPPAFGTPNTQASAPSLPAFGTPSSASFSFGPAGSVPSSVPAPTANTGFGFSTPASGFSAPQLPVASTTTSLPQTTQSTFSFGSNTTTTNFGGTTTTLGQPAATLGQPTGTLGQPTGTLGQPTATLGQPTGILGQPTGTLGQPTGTLGQPSALGQQLSFGQTSLGQPPAFGQAASTTAPASGFGVTSSATTPLAATKPAGTGFSLTGSNPATNLSFGTVTDASKQTPQASIQSSGLPFKPSLSFSATSTPDPAKTTATLQFGTITPSKPTNLTPQIGISATSTGLSTAQSGLTSTQSGLTSTQSGLTSTQTTTATSLTGSIPPSTGGISFGATTGIKPVTSVAATTAASTGFQLGQKPATTGISFGLTTSTAASTVATSGITLGKTTAATTMPSLSTATTTTPATVPQPIASISFTQLEENINKWTIELEEQERTFINQATQVNAWDRLLIANGEKIVELNEAVQSVRNEQQGLENELDFIVAQQAELTELLKPLKSVGDDNIGTGQRGHLYSLAENLDTQMRQMSDDLKEVIEHLNETNRSQDSNDPIVQIGRILNAHMSSMQWVDNSIAQISTKLDHLKTTHDSLRRDSERSFHLTYN